MEDAMPEDICWVFGDGDAGSFDRDVSTGTGIAGNNSAIPSLESVFRRYVFSSRNFAHSSRSCKFSETKEDCDIWKANFQTLRCKTDL